jgi:hypothetical protein
MKTIFLLLCVVLTVSSCANVQKEVRGSQIPQAVDVETLDPPQFEAPGGGMSVNEEFTVVLRKTPTLPCISIPMAYRDATLLISRRLLEQLVLHGREDNLAVRSPTKRLLGQRADAILQTVSDSMDDYGCTKIAEPIPADSFYLLGRLIEAGQLAVVHPKTGLYFPSITVRYFGLEAVGGWVSYGDFLSYRVWVR